MPSRSDIARQIVIVCHRLYQKGFVTATDGNVSARLPQGTILATPSSLNKGNVRENDLVEVSDDGSPVTLSRKPSTELDMHLSIYRERPDVQAIVHAHPTYATGFATARIPIPDCLFPEVIVGLGAIPLADYATPSTKEVAEALLPHVRTSDSILLANHGVVSYGKDLEDAYFKMEKTEQAAQITFIARMLGGEKRLTSEQVDRLRAVSNISYGKDIPEGISCIPADGIGLSEGEIRRLVHEVLAEKLKRS